MPWYNNLQTDIRSYSSEDSLDALPSDVRVVCFDLLALLRRMLPESPFFDMPAYYANVAWKRDAVHQGEYAMMIQVVCRDKSRGFVEDSNLDDAVSMGIVIAFFRPTANEWVDTRNGNIRKKSDSAYAGPERRFSAKKKAPVHTR